MKNLKIKKMSNMTWQKYRIQLENEVRDLLFDHKQETGEQLYCHYFNGVEEFVALLPESNLKNNLQPCLNNAKVLIEIRKEINAIEQVKLEERRKEQKLKDEDRKNKNCFKGVKVSSLELFRYLLSLPSYEPKEGDQVACLIGSGERLHIGSIVKRKEDNELGVRCHKRNYNWGRQIAVCLWTDAKSEFITNT